MDNRSQNVRVWEYIKTHKNGISSLNAMRMEPPILRLASRINEIKNNDYRGSTIKTIWCDTKTKKRAYVRYFI